MPVLECSCGMVMSVSAAEPRVSCIRCGGVTLRVLLARRTATSNAADRIETRPTIALTITRSTEVLQFGATPLEPIAGGC